MCGSVTDVGMYATSKARLASQRHLWINLDVSKPTYLESHFDVDDQLH